MIFLFQNHRYFTRGVENEIPGDVQLSMWMMIDERRNSGKKLDYLQVFLLEPDEELQKITHSQEKPRYKKELFMVIERTPVTAKIFVIDDGDHSTMLLAEEY